MEKVTFPNGFKVWAENGRAVSGIDKNGFSFPLVSIYGEPLKGYTLDLIAWATGNGMIEMPRRSRGIAFRR